MDVLLTDASDEVESSRESWLCKRVNSPSATCEGYGLVMATSMHHHVRCVFIHVADSGKTVFADFSLFVDGLLTLIIILHVESMVPLQMFFSLYRLPLSVTLELRECLFVVSLLLQLEMYMQSANGLQGNCDWL